MHELFEVRSSIRSYPVTMGAGLAWRTMQTRDAHASRIILCDQFFADQLKDSGTPLVPIVATEGTKSLAALSDLMCRLREAGCQRSSEILAVGGGVVQDVATVCASLYMRGIPWRYIPTTLLGMVDSCLGGKSAINAGPYKNLVGNFYPPFEVLIDPSFVRSLSLEQRVGGLCEAAKICYASGQEIFEEFLRNAPDPDSQPVEFEAVIRLSLAAKRNIIERDEFDQGERLLLNFGHTFGHAFEAASGFRISHGIAVGYGMGMAIEFSRLIGGFVAEPERIRALRQYLGSLLKRLPDARTVVESVSVESAVESFLGDKKHKGGAISVIAVEGSGNLVMRELQRTTMSLMLVREAMAVSHGIV